MKTYNPKLTELEKLGYAERVAAAVKNGGKLIIQITHTSKSNMSYRYKVNLFEFDGLEIQLTNLTYWLGAEWDQKVVSAYQGDELKGNGVGTDRYFLAAYEIGLLLKARGLVDSPYEIATRKVYETI